MVIVRNRLRSQLEIHLASVLLGAAGLLVGTTARLHWRGLVTRGQARTVLALAARLRAAAMKIIRTRLRERLPGGWPDA